MIYLLVSRSPKTYGPMRCYAEEVYFKHQVTNLKNKKVTANPKLQSLEKKIVFRKFYTLSPKH